MIQFKNIHNCYRDGGVIYNSTEKKLILDIKKNINSRKVEGFKAMRGYIKSQKSVCEKLQMEIKLGEGSVGSTHLVTSEKMYFSKMCDVIDESVSVDTYLDLYSPNKLLVFDSTRTFYCPVCNKLQSIDSVMGDLECCGITNIIVNTSTKSNDSIIFSKIQKRQEEASLDNEYANIYVEKFNDFDNIYSVVKRKDIKYIKNGYRLILNDEEIGVFDGARLQNKDIFTIRENNYIEKMSYESKYYKIFTEDMLLNNGAQCSSLHYILSSFKVFAQEELNMKISADDDETLRLLRDNKHVIRYVDSLNAEEFKEFFKNVKENNVGGYKLTAMSLGLSLEENSALAFIKCITKNTLIVETSTDSEQQERLERFYDYFATKLTNKYNDGYKNLFEKLASENMRHYVPTVFYTYRSSVIDEFLSAVYEYPFVHNIYKYKEVLGIMRKPRYTDVNKLYSHELTKKEFETMLKISAGASGNVYLHVDESTKDSKDCNISYLSQFSVDFAKRYIENYGADAYSNLCDVIYTNSNDSDHNELAVNNFQQLVHSFEDSVSNTYMFTDLCIMGGKRIAGGYFNDWFSDDSFIESLSKYLKVLYKESKGIKFLADFFELRQNAEDEFPELRGRQENIRRLVLEHDYYLQMVRSGKKDMAGIFRDRYEKFKPFRMKVDNDSFIVEAPREMADIIKEGQELSHCVDSYGQTLENAEEMVLFVRVQRGTPLYTVSLNADGNVCQSAGHSHSLVPAEILASLQREFATDEGRQEALTHFFNK